MKRCGLDTDNFLTVTNIRMVPTEYGQAMILSLLNIGEVLVPEHLKTKIMNSDTYFNPPFYLRPLGRSYDLVFDNGEFLEQIQI